MKVKCPCCMGAGVIEDQTGGIDPMVAIQEECQRLGIKIYSPGLVCRSGAAKLLGYSDSDSFRNSKLAKQINIRRRGGKILYSLKEISCFWSG